MGTAEDAQKDGAELLQPTTDTVTYSDGMSEEVYGFDIPVEAIDEEFDLALIGKKNKWYDHKVKSPILRKNLMRQQQQKRRRTLQQTIQKKRQRNKIVFGQNDNQICSTIKISCTDPVS